MEIYIEIDAHAQTMRYLHLKFFHLIIVKDFARRTLALWYMLYRFKK
jgi:hypothetical protein